MFRESVLDVKDNKVARTQDKSKVAIGRAGMCVMRVCVCVHVMRVRSRACVCVRAYMRVPGYVCTCVCVCTCERVCVIFLLLCGGV